MKFACTAVLCVALGVGFVSNPAVAQQKTVKACQTEWRANKADNQAKGITEKAYVAQCRGSSDASAATPSAAPATPAAPQPTSKSEAVAPAPAATTAPAARPAPRAVATPSGSNQFASENQAKARCPADTVVWVNTNSKIYHFAGYKDYGNTKTGAYMCEKDATGQGFRASKTEKHPT